MAVMTVIKAERSYLFVPADRPDRIGRALQAGADAVIVDLEDAVAPSNKAIARQSLADWLDTAEARPIWVRINAVDGAWAPQDLLACRHPKVIGVMVPKAASASALADVAGALPDRPLLALIENAAGFGALDAVARAPGVSRLVFGTLDFQAELGIEDEDDGLLHFRSRLVLASRLAGLPAPVDGVTPALDDETRLREDTLRARRLGFAGKLCIHPRQVAGVHESFRPTPAEIAWARRVLGAASQQGGAALAVDGRMVDAPVLLQARSVLDRADAIV